MVFYVNSEHPRDLLLFYVAHQPNDETAQRIGALIDECSTARPWVLQPPFFVHQTEEMVDPVTGKPVLTVGGVLEVYSAHPPWRDVLPPEVDRAHYDECRFVIERLCELSRQFGDEIHFEFQGEIVGVIAEGKCDERLQEQFLGTWARAVGAHDSTS